MPQDVITVLEDLLELKVEAVEVVVRVIGGTEVMAAMLVLEAEAVRVRRAVTSMETVVMAQREVCIFFLPSLLMQVCLEVRVEAVEVDTFPVQLEALEGLVLLVKLLLQV
tara:strand:+ start:375 stop:704 length:330 start_codon:yes stop_codon:yes gene_type:complete